MVGYEYGAGYSKRIYVHTIVAVVAEKCLLCNRENDRTEEVAIRLVANIFSAAENRGPLFAFRSCLLRCGLRSTFPGTTVRALPRGCSG